MESIKKNGSDEPRGRTGIKMQMQRMDLRTWGGGRVSWDEVRNRDQLVALWQVIKSAKAFADPGARQNSQE